MNNKPQLKMILSKMSNQLNIHFYQSLNSFKTFTHFIIKI